LSKKIRSKSLFAEQRAQAKPFFPEGFLLKEERAQAETVFRLMIDSIVGLVILVIILSSIAYFNEQVIIHSKTELMLLVQSAASSPDGEILASEDLSFAQGFAVDSSDAQVWTGYISDCFRFDSRYSSVEISSDFRKAEFLQNLQTKVYAQCVSQSCNPANQKNECCIDCLISFGKQIQ